MERRLVSRGAVDPAPRKPLVVAVAVIATTAALIVASYPLRSDRSSAPAPRGGDDVAEASSEGVVAQAPGRTDLAETERLIRAVERRVAQTPNATDLTFLGRLYLQKGRLTGDLATYSQARTALKRSLRIYPTDSEAATLLASVSYTLHDFSAARSQGERILRRDPEALGALAIVGDASLELGDVERAAAIYERLERELPGVAAVDARLARLSWLRGDPELARSLAAEAEREARASGAFGADLAWYRALRGWLEFEAGEYGSALRFYERAARTAPRYPVAQVGRGRSLAATGDTDRAIRVYRRAIAFSPQPEALAALGTLQLALGDERAATGSFEIIAAIDRLARSRGGVHDRQIALFYADRGIKPRIAIDYARAELVTRKDVHGYDALAWTLYADGRYAAAGRASDRALELGTLDAKLLYHAGMIAAAQGDDGRAATLLSEALQLSPRFDPLGSERARATLRRLEVPR